MRSFLHSRTLFFFTLFFLSHVFGVLEGREEARGGGGRAGNSTCCERSALRFSGLEISTDGPSNAGTSDGRARGEGARGARQGRPSWAKGPRERH